MLLDLYKLLEFYSLGMFGLVGPYKLNIYGTRKNLVKVELTYSRFN